MNEHFMRMAIEMAKSAQGQTTPNPLVGAVIVKNNQVIGFGAHLRAGEWHAERHALHMAGEKAKGATIYVTLEPCSHYGRTPPCADAIIEAGIKTVFISSTDPNPKVSGRGIEKLRKAGLEVVVGILAEEADEINKIFFRYIQTKKPFVTLKSATSLDGKIATNSGESQWITSDTSRKDVHKLRHEHDSILVGVNTVLADDPSLTTRLVGGGKNPIRIVLDRQLRTPLEAKIVRDGLAPTWIVTTSTASDEKKVALRNVGVKVIEFTNDILISNLLTTLGEMDISSLLVEGGGKVNDAFLRSGEYQQVIVYIAPTIIGGENAPSSFSGTGFTHLNDVPNLKIDYVEHLGKDLKITLSKGER